MFCKFASVAKTLKRTQQLCNFFLYVFSILKQKLLQILSLQRCAIQQHQHQL